MKKKKRKSKKGIWNKKRQCRKNTSKRLKWIITFMKQEKEVFIKKHSGTFKKGILKFFSSMIGKQENLNRGVER